VLDFMKLKMEVRASTLKLAKQYLKELTDAEQLPNHYEAVRSRFK